MRHPLVVTIGLALAGCSSEPPQPATLAVSVAPAASSLSPPAVFDADVAILPVRPAGAALATASEEHALVRRLPAPKPATAMPVAQPAATPSATAGGSLPARVLAVQAAYRRWCAGDQSPGDGPLLAEAGGVRLPGAIACEPPQAPSAEKLPRLLFPAHEQTGAKHL
ncbi:MAG: hypothetical protein AB7I59_01830 [Geminicoccaceae bacterium]